MSILSILAYYLIILPVSFLPNKLLYASSDFLFFIIYHVFRYRRKVVTKNLKKAFPEKSSKEISKIERQFYKHFTDFLVESARAMNYSPEKIMEFCKAQNLEVVENQLSKGKHVFVLAGHYNNWEYYSVILSKLFNYPMIAAYQPLSNPFFDKILKKNREKGGLKLVPLKELPSYLKAKDSEPTIVFLLIDQRPKSFEKAFWNTFLNQKTAWMRGGETLARMFDSAVAFGYINKEKRGDYTVDFKLLSEDSQSEEKGSITNRFAEELEEQIVEHPSNWLWSHKRWKNQ